MAGDNLYLIRSIILIIFMMWTGSAAYGDKLTGYNIYFVGLVKHFNTTSDNKEGNMEYFALSKDFKKGSWLFETGAGTYIDSYHLRSYIVFSNISHDRFTYGRLKPMLSLGCTYKGRELNDDRRETICAPLPKIRFGKDKGFFTNITGFPKYKNLTNGLIAIEVGYKF